MMLGPSEVHLSFAGPTTRDHLTVRSMTSAVHAVSFLQDKSAAQPCQVSGRQQQLP